MYNTWAQAETISFAEQYTQALLAGYSATASTGQTFSLTLPARMIALGFPASPNGAGSGFIKPTDVCAMICAFKANGTTIAL